jgi:hypothetical protein
MAPGAEVGAVGQAAVGADLDGGEVVDPSILADPSVIANR